MGNYSINHEIVIIQLAIIISSPFFYMHIVIVLDYCQIQCFPQDSDYGRGEGEVQGYPPDFYLERGEESDQPMEKVKQ